MAKSQQFKDKYARRIRYTTGSWFPCEENVLVLMYQQNYRVSYIAKVLARDRCSVHMKIKIMVKNGLLERKYVKEPIFYGHRHNLGVSHAA